MIEKVPSDSEFLRHLKSTSDYELYDMEFVKLAVDTQEGQAIGVFNCKDKVLGFELNALEGTMFTFIKSGCFQNSHLKNIYQMYLETMELIKFDLLEVVIEAKTGDMTYSRLKWRDHKGRIIYKFMSAGDGLVLGSMVESEFKITKKAFEEMDDFSNFDEEFEEYDE